MLLRTMTRLLFLFLILGSVSAVEAQQKTSAAAGKDSTSAAKKDSAASAKDTILNDLITANDLKSGNLQDVLTSFFQLAATNLTGPKKQVSFQSSLLGIKSKVDTTLLVDTNYIHHRFDRNLQFNFSLGLDSNYQFSGFSGGITYALVNGRDSTVFSLVGPIANNWKSFIDSMEIYELEPYRESLLDSNRRYFKTKADSISYDSVGKGLNAILGNLDSINADKFPSGFVKFLQAKQISLPAASYAAAVAGYRQRLQAIRVKPLLTMSLNSAFTKAAGFDSAQLGLVYLQGLNKTGRSLEVDYRANFIVKDSTVGTDKYRSRFNTTLGLDYALLSVTNPKAGTYAPIFEVKPYFELDHLFSALLTGEKRDVVYAAADLRLKITNNLWLPITLKYSVTGKKNFLGFLNFSFNMNSFKSTTSKKAS